MTRILVKLKVSIHELVILSARLFLRDKIQFYLDMLIHCFGPFVNVYRSERTKYPDFGFREWPHYFTYFYDEISSKEKRTALTRSHMKFHPMIFQNMS